MNSKYVRSTLPRMNRSQKLRIRYLLDTIYTPAELAHAIGCHRDTIYRGFIPAGCPYKKDVEGRIAINGLELRTWYEENKPQKRELAPGEAWCFRCNVPVVMQPPLTSKPTNLFLELVSGTCPNCGSTVNRARARRTQEQER